MSDLFYDKYLKYKKKYLELKKLKHKLDNIKGSGDNDNSEEELKFIIDSNSNSYRDILYQPRLYYHWVLNEYMTNSEYGNSRSDSLNEMVKALEDTDISNLFINVYSQNLLNRYIGAGFVMFDSARLKKSK